MRFPSFRSLRSHLSRRRALVETLERRELFAGLNGELPIASDDLYGVGEDSVLEGNMIGDDTGNGTDVTRSGLPLVLKAIEGKPAAVGEAMLLDSGATLTVSANGGFEYLPNSSSTLNALDDGDVFRDSFDYEIGLGFSDIVVFGDSLSDTGNLSDLTGGAFPPSPPYFGGRSAGGALWVDHLAPRILLDPEANNFAFFGATTGRENFNDERLDADLPGLQDELDLYLSGLGSAGADPNALYVVWAGPNDLLFPFDDPGAKISEMVTNMVTTVGTLSAFGAQHIMVPDMPDLGDTPFVKSLGLSDELTALSNAFNGALSSTFASLGMNVIPFDTQGVLADIEANAEALGFTVTDAPCFDGASLCSNPDEYFFFDSFHPSSHVHELISDAMLSGLMQQQPLASSDVGTVEIDVQGVTTRPEAAIAGPGVGVPGQTLEFVFSATDAANVDQAARFTYQIDWNGDGSDVTTVDGPASGVVLSHVYESLGSVSLMFTATDHDGDQSPAASHDLTVQPFAVQNGNVYVGGTLGSDSIRIRSGRFGNVQVTINRHTYDSGRLEGDARVVVFGLAGNDRIFASGTSHNVDVEGGDGNDFIIGGQGDDRLSGGNGNDLIFGGKGNDRLFGGAGSDFLLGWQGDDELDGGDGFDWLFGGPGDDIFHNGELVRR